MRCHQSGNLHRLVDDELDAVARATIERHVAGCAHCSAERRRIDLLRHDLHDEALRHPLPASLLTRVTALVADTTPAVVDRPARSRGSVRRWHWLGSGALGGAAITAGAFLLVPALVTALGPVRADQRTADEAVAAHGRATMTGHLVDVVSSDHHTVKPWLSGHLDYSPPVPDLAAEGFTLIGGRVDRLERMPVATLVYGYGHHTIDVFVRPSSDERGSTKPALVRGFNVMEARGSGMDWVGVSDVNTTQLGVLMQRLAASDAETGPEPAGDR